MRVLRNVNVLLRVTEIKAYRAKDNRQHLPRRVAQLFRALWIYQDPEGCSKLIDYVYRLSYAVHFKEA